MIGLTGVVLNRSNLIKTFMSIEIMILAGVINFAYMSYIDNSKIGHIFSITAITVSCLVFAIIFSIYTKNNNKGDLLDDE
jgi:NADH:ubiquinone oxidoreductase subunit K